MKAWKVILFALALFAQSTTATAGISQSSMTSSALVGIVEGCLEVSEQPIDVVEVGDGVTTVTQNSDQVVFCATVPSGIVSKEMYRITMSIDARWKYAGGKNPSGNIRFKYTLKNASGYESFSGTTEFLMSDVLDGNVFPSRELIDIFPADELPLQRDGLISADITVIKKSGEMRERHVEKTTDEAGVLYMPQDIFKDAESGTVVFTYANSDGSTYTIAMDVGVQSPEPAPEPVEVTQEDQPQEGNIPGVFEVFTGWNGPIEWSEDPLFESEIQYDGWYWLDVYRINTYTNVVEYPEDIEVKNIDLATPLWEKFSEVSYGYGQHQGTIYKGTYHMRPIWPNTRQDDQVSVLGWPSDAGPGPEESQYQYYFSIY